MSKVEKRRLAKLKQRFLCRKVIAIWKQFAIKRRPRVLTEEEEMQIRTIKKWNDKVCISQEELEGGRTVSGFE